MKTNIKKIIIVLVVIVVAIVAYQYFFAKETPAKPATALSSSKTATNTTSATTANTATTAKVPVVKKDTDFLSTLLNISKIKVDGTIFSSPSFNSLQDNNVPIINEETVGRSNPFAPLEGVQNTLNINTGTDQILGEVIPFTTN